MVEFLRRAIWAGVPAPTPPIPAAIRSLRAPGFRNIFELADPSTLYGTESMAGDWSGRLLLLTKDFGPSSVIEARLAAGERAVWYHAPAWPTNRWVADRMAENGIDVADPRATGVLYGSVCWLLRADGVASGPLPPGWRGPASVVLGFTLAHMPRLRAIACAGKDSFAFVTAELGIRADWRRHRDARAPAVTPGGLEVHALSHPGNLGTLSRLRGAPWAEKEAAAAADWRAMMGRVFGQNRPS